LLAAAEASWQAGDADRTVELVDEAERLHASAATGVRGLALRGEVATHCGAPGRAHGFLLAAADTVLATDPSLAVLLVADAVTAGFLQGSAATTLAAGRRLEELLRAAACAVTPVTPVSPVALAVGRLAAGVARVFGGLPGIDLIRDGATALDGMVAGDRASVRPAWLMFGPLFLRESGTVRGLVRAALDETRARSQISTLPMLLFLLARDGATTDRWSGAEADYSEAVVLSRETGHTTQLAVSLAGLSWLQARQGRAEQCRDHAAQTLELCGRHAVDLARVWAELALGELALSLGEVAEAADRLARLDTFLDDIDLRDPDLSPVPDLVEALLRRGDVDQARVLTAGYRDAALAKGLPWSMARAERLRGLLADPSQADECFEAALALHAQTLDVFEEARTRLAYGACLRRGRRRVDARTQLRTALATFDRLGADRWADTAAAELAATGETVSRPAAAAGATLTPRETQVALLLAEGRTTRQTAAALFLSPKTVEYHLRHVYTKLGIGSRAELVTALRGSSGG
jgi:DNA-binding CsgD family transcriptional regulator/tetratricopeptide (TPR) repeat protein